MQVRIIRPSYSEYLLKRITQNKPTLYIKKLRVLGGAIDDFSKAVAKIPYAATVELSGTDRDGYGNRV